MIYQQQNITSITLDQRALVSRLRERVNALSCGPSPDPAAQILLRCTNQDHYAFVVARIRSFLESLLSSAIPGLGCNDYFADTIESFCEDKVFGELQLEGMPPHQREQQLQQYRELCRYQRDGVYDFVNETMVPDLERIREAVGQPLFNVWSVISSSEGLALELIGDYRILEWEREHVTDDTYRPTPIVGICTSY